MNPAMGTSSAAPAQSVRNILFALLFLVTLLAALAEFAFLDQPGMMDACYYYSGGLSLVRGQGWTEPFLWNYLDENASLPLPGNMYWMPLASLLSAGGMLVFGEGFHPAQIPFLILAVGFPFLVFSIARRLSGSFAVAIGAGFLSIASGFYTVYWVDTENFLLFAWLGGLFFLSAEKLQAGSRWYYALLIGGLCGLAHLSRADGVVFLGLAGLLVLADGALKLWGRIRRWVLLGAGYLAVTGFWYVRNLSVWGSVFPPGSGKALWLTEYNDIFQFPSSGITAERFFSSGWESLLAGRWSALQSNLQTVLFVIGLVFLFPLLVWGIFLLRRRKAVQSALIYFGVVFFLMTAVYPFQGMRGGLLHSAAALLSVTAAAASAALFDILQRLGRRRSWDLGSAQILLGGGIILLALISSGIIFNDRVVDLQGGTVYWSTLYGEYPRGIDRLGEDLPPSTRFMVNNPPCFYVRTGYSAVTVPSGSVDRILAVADRYDVRYVILEENLPDLLAPLFRGETEVPRLKRLFSEEYQGTLFVWFEVLYPEDTP
jgi:4-amino-4-deoxy-L-arabinose transferase-like glycosyltransferase